MRLLLVGCGNWGGKLATRFIRLLNDGNVAFADLDMSKLPTHGDLPFPQIDYTRLLDWADAVAIATPPVTHYEIARRCLEAGKHVLVEKPMTLNWDEAKSLVSLAQKKQLTLMTDDTFLYHDWTQNAGKNFASAFEAHWTGPRTPNPSTPVEGILWDLGPHSVSLMLKLMGRYPIDVGGHVKPRSAALHYSFTGHEDATIILDWETPVRERYVFFRDQSGASYIDFDDPTATRTEPLVAMCRRFIERVKAPPWIDTHALNVVATLAMAEERCKSG